MLKVPSELRTDSVVFSFLGFQQKSFIIDSLAGLDKTIILSEKTIQITPVYVKNIVAEEVVKQAMQMVSQNYPIVNFETCAKRKRPRTSFHPTGGMEPKIKTFSK